MAMKMNHGGKDHMGNGSGTGNKQSGMMNDKQMAGKCSSNMKGMKGGKTGEDMDGMDGDE